MPIAGPGAGGAKEASGEGRVVIGLLLLYANEVGH